MTVVIEVLSRLAEGPQIGPIDLPEILGLPMIGLGVALIVVMFWKRGGITGALEIDEHIAGWRRRRAAEKHGPQAILPSRSHMEGLPVPEPREDSGRRLVASNVSKDFGGIRALDNVSLELRRGEILGLIGPNGSGKTTLINVLSGALPLTGGHVAIDGTDITDWPAHRIARRGIGRTFQNIKILSGMTVFYNILAGAMSPTALSLEDPEHRATRLLLEFDLEEYTYQSAEDLSYGPQRILEIARAVALEPSFLLLDEPAAGMIRKESDQLVETLKKLRDNYEMGLLVVDHDLKMIMNLCERVVVLNEGQVIADGDPGEVQQNSHVIEAYIGRKRKAEQRSGEELPDRTPNRNHS